MIAICSDHGGYALKKALMSHLSERGLEYKDFGAYSEASCDYPVYAKAVAHAVADGECECGILICGTGIGMSMAANKVKGIRAALCGDVCSAAMSREHNNANVICLGERVLGAGLAARILDAWLDTEFAGGRHERRVNKIMAIEE
jgi:ribose 5-phosphate isomerase B